MKQRPMFSVVIVTLNAEKEIEHTIKSIQNQTYSDFEVVVKDGGSKDSTLMKVPNEDRYRIYIIEDCSVYEGMNQAVELAKGNFIIFLNAGDAFATNNTLSEVSEFIYRNKIENSKCILYGNYYRKNDGLQNQPVVLSDFYLYRRPLCHQSLFYSRKLFAEFGEYNTDIKISADHEYTMRLWKARIPFLHIKNVVCIYEGGGISESSVGWKTAIEERKTIRMKYYSKMSRIKYETILRLSFSGIRAWLDSESSPRFLNKIYISLRNGIFK